MYYRTYYCERILFSFLPLSLQHFIALTHGLTQYLAPPSGLDKQEQKDIGKLLFRIPQSLGMGGLTNFAIVCDFLSALILIGVARRSASIFRTLTSFCKGYSLSDQHVQTPINLKYNDYFVRFTKIYTNCCEIQNTTLASFEFQNNLCKSL